MRKLIIQKKSKGLWSIVYSQWFKRFKTIDYRLSTIDPLVFILLFCLCFGIYHYSFAQDNEKIVTLSKQIIEAKTSDALYAPFEELRNIYLKDNKYSEFIDFLNSIEPKNKLAGPFINYYIALARYSQLKYLEEKQVWDEYFAQGNAYRDEITANVKAAIDKTSTAQAINIYARLLIWQFHKDQQDAFVDESLSDLMNAAVEFAKSAKGLKPIKEAADKLSIYAEKGKSKVLYSIYAQNLASSGMKDDALLNNASSFYKEGNLELSETLYDTYIERISKSLPKEKSIPVLIDTAKLFAYKDQGANDPLYAQKLFKKIEELGGKDIFDQELMYLRAFNLEKAKEFSQAKDIYVDLIGRFPQTIHNTEAIFKAGIISTYISGDIKTGREYFQKLAQREKDFTPQVISGLYQLGLLSQWEGDSAKAKDYYNKLINAAGKNFQDTVALALQRLKEIEEGKPIEYNLKTFLDISLKENSLYNMTKSDLKSSIYRLNKDQEDNITSNVSLPESGCMQVELQYLWSGHTGSANPSSKQSSFNTSYTSPGTKEINLVIVSPIGIIDRNIDLVDVN